MSFFRLAYVAEDEQRAREEPRAALTWIRYLQDAHQVHDFGVNMDFGLLTHA
jgi:hypothetical protein